MTSIDKAAIVFTMAIVAIALGFTAGQSFTAEVSQNQSESTEDVSFRGMVEDTTVMDTSPPLVCSLGQFAALGDLLCTDAPAGSFVNTTGATSSTLCPAGTYQPETGQSLCILCPIKTVSEPGAISCMVCLQSDLNQCVVFKITFPAIFVPLTELIVFSRVYSKDFFLFHSSITKTH